MYRIDVTKKADKGITKLYMSEPQAYKKLEKLIQELEEHPETGTGRPKPLGGDKAGQWSRRITEKHRIIYRIVEAEKTVIVLSVYGHYDDK
ncbi:MAG: Txe/YoeB family addiction module toxin [Prevotellaceae bacterium]|jgi:toxin YoeB|nr:Txe/YoeB family addiction module toxin [Prevotellaceae bacterium]